jgi:O-methyltransferase
MNTTYADSLHAFRKTLLADLRQVRMTQLKPGFSHEQVIPHATYAPWRDDQKFLACYDRVRTNTLVDVYRCYELWQLAHQMGPESGHILEVGTWRGGTAAILGVAAQGSRTERHLWIADTFAGVVKTNSAIDTLYKGGEHSDTSEVLVRDFLQSLDITNYTILTGIFPDETGHRFPNERIGLCHIDVDAYDSAGDVFRWVWPRISLGGVVVFDDFGFWGCEGVSQLVNELRIDNGILIRNLNGHAIICKVKEESWNTHNPC